MYSLKTISLSCLGLLLGVISDSRYIRGTKKLLLPKNTHSLDGPVSSLKAGESLATLSPFCICVLCSEPVVSCSHFAITLESREDRTDQ
jgi:hypothetical protein